ncbi:MAG: SH3 domain-containing C40 family peptidase [Bacteroides sp.]
MKPFIFTLFLLFASASCLAQTADAVSSGEKKYGIVNLSVCNLRAKPDFSSEMITQALLGMPVKLLQKQAWYYIQTPDDYTGWVHRAGVQLMTKAEYEAWNRTEKIVVTSLYGFTYEKPHRKAQTVSDVTGGDRLKWEGSQGGFYEVSYPDGRRAYIDKSISKPEKAWRAGLKKDANSLVRTAYTMMGIPYLWAGTSAKGMDCSGFVRTVLFLHDMIIPRDASQQASVGERLEIAPACGNLQPGDLIFFGRKATAGIKERVSHVGIYIGHQKFIHSMGDVHISSFNPQDKEFDAYNLGRLLFAGRVLPFIDKQVGLNTTLTNPYYY